MAQVTKVKREENIPVLSSRLINLSQVMVMVFRVLGIMSDDDLDLQCIDQQQLLVTNIQKKTLLPSGIGELKNCRTMCNIILV